MIEVSPVAKQIAAKVSPALQVSARDHEDEIVAGAGNTFERLAVKAVYPMGLKLIPAMTEIGFDAFLSYLLHMPLAEVASTLTAHGLATRQAVHPSIVRAAGH